MHTMQIKFARNGKIVDKEMRDAIPNAPALASLSDEQMALIESCRSLESEEGSKWEFLTSPSPFVDMWIKYTPPRKNERSVGLGKATATIDCSVREAFAYSTAFMSRERARINAEAGHPARLIHSGTPHDCIVGTIKKFPFPLKNREFVNRQVSARGSNGDFVLAYDPLDNVLDYGMKTKAVRGVSRAFMRFSASGESACEVELYQYLDAAGSVPEWLVNSKAPQALATVVALQNQFQRDDEVDRLERDELARIVMDEPQTYTAEEDTMINAVHATLGSLEWERFEELESPDHLVKMGKIFFAGSSSAVGRATVTVDASVEECAVWEMAKMSRENRAGHLAFGGLECSLRPENGHHNTFRTVYDPRIPGILPREFIQSQIWKLQESKFAVAYKSLEEHVDFPFVPQYVRGAASALWEYEKLPHSGNTPQTRVTYTQKVYHGGLIPKSVVNRDAVSALLYASTMRKRFDKSLEIDGAARALNIELIMGHADEYLEGENALLGEGEKHFADFKAMKVKSLEMASPLTTAEIAFGKDGHAWGRVTTTVRTSPEEVLAFLWDTTRRSARREGDLEKSVEEQANGHNMLVYNMKMAPKMIRDRDFLSRCVWKKEGEGFLLVTSPEESDARPITEGVVRGKYPSGMRIKRKNDWETTLEYVIHPDAGGHLKGFLANRHLGSSLGRVTEIQEFFQELRKIKDYDADDGKALGVRLMHPGGEKGKKPWRKLRDVVGRHRGLTELSIEFDWLIAFLEEVVRGKWVMAGSVSTKLVCLSEMEARKIGRSLMSALKSRKTAEAGLYQWKMQNLSMVELFERHDWVESMMLEVAQEVMKTAPWGLMWRVCTGASVSMLDIVTDVVVIVSYMGKEETRGYGYSLLGMLVGSMVLQLLIVFSQTRKKPWEMAKEMLIVITGLKPVWDAMAVCSGKKMEEHHLMDAKTELVASKMAEMICESIPGKSSESEKEEER